MIKNGLLTEYTLSQISEIETKFFVADLVKKNSEKIVVVTFSGVYGVGSQGNTDALFMASMIHTAISIWSPKGIILDLSKLSYSWGDMMSMVLVSGKLDYSSALEREIMFGSDAEENIIIPTIVVTSELNLEGLKSLAKDEMDIDPEDWYFDSLDSAMSSMLCRLK